MSRARRVSRRRKLGEKSQLVVVIFGCVSRQHGIALLSSRNGWPVKREPVSCALKAIGVLPAWQAEINCPCPASGGFASTYGGVATRRVRPAGSILGACRDELCGLLLSVSQRGT